MRQTTRTIPRRESKQDRRLKKIMVHLDIMDTLLVPGVGLTRIQKKDAVWAICREITRLQERIKDLENPRPRKVPYRAMKAVQHGD